VLGLEHEQQNPEWWHKEGSGPPPTNWYGGDRSSDLPAFDDSNFHCNRLYDYDSVKAKIERDLRESALKAGKSYDQSMTDAEMARACHRWASANKWGFSAKSILPKPPFTAAISNEKRTEPDWKSIMMYPSRANGRELTNGVRDIVYTKWDGTEVKENLCVAKLSY
jgi:hypothetical protein